MVLKKTFDRLCKKKLMSKHKQNHSHSFNYALLSVIGRIMKSILLSEVVKPILRRLGSIMAGSLLTFGFADDQAIQVAEALTTVLLIACDLISSHWERKN